MEHESNARAWPELNREVRETWDANADFWDSNMGEGNAFHLQLIGPTVERLLAVRPGERVIDVACGNGQFSRRLAELDATVRAFDIAPGMIEAARRRTAERADLADRVVYEILDATNPVALAALGERVADAAVCNMAIMDMAEIAPMLAAVRRALVPGGRFVFATAHPCFNHSGMRLAVEEWVEGGDLVMERSIRVVTYRTTGAAQGIAMVGQPRTQWYFERTLSEILNACFVAGFVLDAIEEPAFPSGRRLGRSPIRLAIVFRDPTSSGRTVAAGVTAMTAPVQRAPSIPPLAPAEAIELERSEFERFIQAATELSPEDWSLPVPSSRGDIHALVAHVTGTYAAQANLSELWRQANPQILRLYRMEGDSLADTVARVQTGDRAHRSSSELLEELRTVGPVAIEHRRWAFRPLQIVSRAIGDGTRFPDLPLSPFRAVRDLWYHRLDMAEASGAGMRIDSQHDGRVLEVLARARAELADGQLGARTVDLTINGLDQARWRFGLPSDPDAVILLDPIGFAKLVAQRRSPAATRERAQIEGDVKTAMLLLTALHHGRHATR